MSNGRYQEEPNSLDKVYMITSDRRVAELVQHVTKMLKESGESDEPPADVMVTPLATGNKDYIDWIKKVTTPKEESDFYKENPDEALEAVKKIGGGAASDDEAASKSSGATEEAESSEDANVQLEEELL